MIINKIMYYILKVFFRILLVPSFLRTNIIFICIVIAMNEHTNKKEYYKIAKNLIISPIFSLSL